MNTLLPFGFLILSIAMGALVARGARSWRLGVAIGLWMEATSLLARSGVLANFDRMPPPAGITFLVGFALTIWLGGSRLGARLAELPFAWLIGAQSFRILVELLIHRAVELGIAPPQMTWSGMNFDIVTGVTALLLAPFANRLPRAALLLWNTMGLGLLAWVVGVAVVSFPTRFQILQPDSSWVSRFPYVWLPTVLVTVALLGHVIVYRKCRTAASSIT